MNMSYVELVDLVNKAVAVKVPFGITYLNVSKEEVIYRLKHCNLYENIKNIDTIKLWNQEQAVIIYPKP